MKQFIFTLLFVFLTGIVFSQSIIIENPNGGEHLLKGKNYIIKWIASGTSNGFKITLWRNNSLIGVIKSDISSGNGHRNYSWIVGSYIGGVADSGTGYKIKIKEKSTFVADMSDNSFFIDGKKIYINTNTLDLNPIEIIKPGKNTNWGEGTEVSIRWKYTFKDVVKWKIELFGSNGKKKIQDIGVFGDTGGIVKWRIDKGLGSLFKRYRIKIYPVKHPRLFSLSKKFIIRIQTNTNKISIPLVLTHNTHYHCKRTGNQKPHSQSKKKEEMKKYLKNNCVSVGHWGYLIDYDGISGSIAGDAFHGYIRRVHILPKLNGLLNKLKNKNYIINEAKLYFDYISTSRKGDSSWPKNAAFLYITSSAKTFIISGSMVSFDLRTSNKNVKTEGRNIVVDLTDVLEDWLSGKVLPGGFLLRGHIKHWGPNSASPSSIINTDRCVSVTKYKARLEVKYTER